MKKVALYDTTLRSAGAMSIDAKLLVARALADRGVDVIEAGYPGASAGEAEAVARIARAVRGPTIAALAAADRREVEAAGKALNGAARSRIHVFMATSDHELVRLGISRSECLARTTAAVSRAAELADEVEFSAEDATRSDVDFLNAVCQTAAAAGARMINVADAGHSQPREYAALVLAVRAALASFSRLSFSAHGPAVANTIAAVEAGADQAHVTMGQAGLAFGDATPAD
jgi:2-isopropylmalate synthase